MDNSEGGAGRKSDSQCTPHDDPGSDTDVNPRGLGSTA